MKNLIKFLLCAIFCLLVVGCGEQEQEQEVSDNQSEIADNQTEFNELNQETDTFIWLDRSQIEDQNDQLAQTLQIIPIFLKIQI